jgi:hypothetical protein
MPAMCKNLARKASAASRAYELNLAGVKKHNPPGGGSPKPSDRNELR